MNIVSNDVLANIPGNEAVSSGGIGTFAKHFSRFCISQGHAWNGLIFKTNKRLKNVRIKLLDASQERKTYTRVETPWIPRDAQRITAKTFQRSIDQVKTHLTKLNPDIVFLNGIWYPVWLYLRAAHELGIPTVVQHAGMAKVEIDIYKDLIPAGRRNFMYSVERDATKFADFEIFLNETTRRFYAKNVAKPAPKHSGIIPLPIEETACKPKRVGIRPRVPRIGLVARWDRIKNQPGFLAIALEAKKQGLNWEFHSVTSIPKTKAKLELKEAYRKHIHVHAPMPRSELRKFYRKMDLMVLPSFFDVSPHVVTEAACEGTGTLISNNVGWADAYKKTGNASWITDFTKPKQVVRKIDQLAGKNLSPAFLRYLRTTHNHERVFNEYLKTFRRLVEKRS